MTAEKADTIERAAWREDAAPNPQARRGYRERDRRIIALLDALDAAESRAQSVALTHGERLALAEQIRVAFDTPPDQRVIQDTWLYAAAMAEQWYVDRGDVGAPTGDPEDSCCTCGTTAAEVCHHVTDASLPTGQADQS